MSDSVDNAVDTGVEETIDNSLFSLGTQEEQSHMESDVVDESGQESESEVPESEVPVERPEWLPEKFKTPEAMVDSYKNLESRMGAFTGAPEGDYEVKVPEGFEEFSFYEGTEHDVNAFSEMAKEMNMSQEAFDKTMELYIKSECERAGQEHKMREHQAIEMFGGEKEAPQRIAALTAKAQSNFTAEEFNVLKDAASGSPSSAASAMRFAEMMLSRQSGSTPVDAGGFRSVPQGRTAQELREALVSDKYSKDSEFRAQIDAEWTQALKDGRIKR